MTVESPVPEDEAANDATPVLTLIKQIKENKIDPAVLSAADRRRCVEVLWGEGYTVAEIAQILKRAERTIHRDRSELRAAHALHVHPQFAAQMAGELIRQAEGSAGRLRRIARGLSVHRGTVKRYVEMAAAATDTRRKRVHSPARLLSLAWTRLQLLSSLLTQLLQNFLPELLLLSLDFSPHLI